MNGLDSKTLPGASPISAKIIVRRLDGRMAFVPEGQPRAPRDLALGNIAFAEMIGRVKGSSSKRLSEKGVRALHGKMDAGLSQSASRA